MPGAAKEHLETHFQAEILAEGAVLTGYFEPVYRGALERSDSHPAPVYAVPEGWQTGQSFASRTEIVEKNLLAGRELAWLASPLDAFLLQVQGSGRIALPDASELRLGFAGKNGHPYVSLGRLLLERGALTPEDVSMQALRAWYDANPEDGAKALLENPSFVFFKPLEIAPELGPIGTAGVPLTPQRSIAVDPAATALGSLIYLDIPDADTSSRLCVAQDTGGAIKGPGRTDLFCGTGDIAGEQAGKLFTTIRSYQLVPRAGV